MLLNVILEKISVAFSNGKSKTSGHAGKPVARFTNEFMQVISMFHGSEIAQYAKKDGQRGDSLLPIYYFRRGIIAVFFYNDNASHEVRRSFINGILIVDVFHCVQEIVQ